MLGVSRSAYYNWKQASSSARSIQDRTILKEIRIIHARRHMKAYGSSPRMTAELNDRGIAYAFWSFTAFLCYLLRKYYRKPEVFKEILEGWSGAILDSECGRSPQII